MNDSAKESLALMARLITEMGIDPLKVLSTAYAMGRMDGMNEMALVEVKALEKVQERIAA